MPGSHLGVNDFNKIFYWVIFAKYSSKVRQYFSNFWNFQIYNFLNFLRFLRMTRIFNIKMHQKNLKYFNVFHSGACKHVTFLKFNASASFSTFFQASSNWEIPYKTYTFFTNCMTIKSSALQKIFVSTSTWGIILFSKYKAIFTSRKMNFQIFTPMAYIFWQLEILPVFELKFSYLRAIDFLVFFRKRTLRFQWRDLLYLWHK